MTTAKITVLDTTDSLIPELPVLVLFPVPVSCGPGAPLPPVPEFETVPDGLPEPPTNTTGMDVTASVNALV